MDDIEQLDALIGDQVHKQEHLFGAGSKIIITTRNRDPLIAHGLKIYYLKEQEYPHSLELFRLHAFEDIQPSLEFLDLSEKVVKVAGGLPLALKVFGSHLKNRDRQYWEVELGKLEKHPHEKVLERLKISYDGLNGLQKNVFLDIACFLIGSTKEQALYMWEDRYAAYSAVNALESKSLISMYFNNEFRMHDQVRDMGRWIVKVGNNKPHNYSRVWDSDDIFKLLGDAKNEKEVDSFWCLYLHDELYDQDGCEIIQGSDPAIISFLSYLTRL
ncbi:TMV resistance protein [Nymphaea thermarum]|nr:TMV resistance protein [Nymphaea thermarum]